MPATISLDVVDIAAAVLTAFFDADDPAFGIGHELQPGRHFLDADYAFQLRPASRKSNYLGIEIVDPQDDGVGRRERRNFCCPTRRALWNK